MKYLLLSILAALFACALSPRLAPGADPRRPNVLFIAIDDLRPQLGCYGNQLVRSPNIDALAARGLRFNRAYCQLALCNPSRASLLSGRRPESLRIFDLKTFVRDAAPDVVTLPELFKKNGYRTLSFGKIFHTGNGNHDDPTSWSEKPFKPKWASTTQPAPKVAEGEDPNESQLPWEAVNTPEDALPDGQIARAAIAALRASRGKPFFIGVGFHKPHLPFVAPRKYFDLYNPGDFQLPPNRTHPKGAPEFATNDASELRRYLGMPDEGPIPDAEARKLIHAYHACVSYTDGQVGKVLKALDDAKLRDNTIVVLLGDHGYHLGEQGTWNKRTNWEIATRVPLIVATPKQPTAGQQTKALVELVDLYPTLAELCGLPVPEKLEGSSFVPLLSNPNRAWKSAAFSVYQKKVEGMGLTLGRAMRTDRYRFIEWSSPDREKVVHELYDHLNDPQETTNLANRQENSILIGELTQQLLEGWTSALPARESLED
jgi:arylsulfatase A-like enzyme